MKWTDCSNRMNEYVIKRDGTAVENEYFLATHVPFRELQFVEYGDFIEMKTDAGKIKAVDENKKPVNLTGLSELTEEEIYDKCIINRSNKHQMIVVHGENGTGKSHLICWLHNRLINDEKNYHPDTEKVVFLRRLGNTVKGAVQQMLDEGLVQNNELRDKFIKFCNADKSQSEEEFKASIYSEYVKKVITDSSNKPYTKTKRKEEIAAFLYDSRVQQYLMRENGPIDKCYKRITKGVKAIASDKTGEDKTNEIFTDEIFQKEDFKFPPKVETAIETDSADEVKTYYLGDLNDDDDAITKLVEYLNHFTSGVMQNCANITSENARDLFVDLRKSLHREGKNLTIFIEDFTSFSIVESELITALAVENGGEYSDLCRVTSIIGITDGYYRSFKDNFKDRVTSQIFVTEPSFGDQKFLLELAARYLNAIYSTKEQIAEWYERNNGIGALPDPAFSPAMEWDYVEIGGKKYTLFPFNKKSLTKLYEGLKHKSPRNYLTKVIGHSFEKFADCIESKDHRFFPEITGDISVATLQPPYADSIENTDLSDTDKQRLKLLLNVWGDGSTKASNGNIGGVPVEFLKQIGLGNFKGVGSYNNPNKPSDSQHAPAVAATDKKTYELKENQEYIDFKNRKEDIESWFEKKTTLEYSSDFNKWVERFAVQCIDWQDEGLPGELVIQRLRNGSFVYIEDSKQDTESRAVIQLKRSPESRTILMGLALFDYYHNWNFENAPYYQLVMINWIQNSKQEIIRNLFGNSTGTKEHPIITWCIAAQYIDCLLNGEDLDESKPEKLLTKLFGEHSNNQVHRTNEDWNDVLTYLNNQKEMQKIIHGYMIRGSNTIMGIVGDRSPGNAKFYRTAELFNSIRHLQNLGWDINGEIQNPTSKFLENIRTYLQKLYAKVKVVTESEKRLSARTITIFEELIGNKPSEQGYINAVKKIKEFFTNCNAAREFYPSELKSRFENQPPKDQAKTAMSLYNTLKKATQSNDSMELLLVFSKAPREKFDEINTALLEIENLAKEILARRSKMLGTVDQIDPLMLNGALNKLEELSHTIDSIEVEA